MLDFSKLGKTNLEERIAKELFLELIEKQLTFSQSMTVCQMMQQTLATWGKNWLDHQYCTHLKNFFEEERGKLK